MKNEKMLQALNEQINAEFSSAYLYLSMAAYFESINLKGCATWMQIQAGEEMEHGKKIYNFIIERRWLVKLTAISAPQREWKSPLAAFTAAFEHELKVTAMIHRLVEMANQSKDYATAAFLQWFVNEQVEEEANADEIVQKFKVVGDCKTSIMYLDHQLGKRKSD